MTALKEILADQVGTSPLASSPMWEQPVGEIDPTQITAFIARLSELGRRDQAESAVEIALAAITRAVGNNQLPVPKMLSYYRPNRTVLTSTEFKNGLLILEQPRAAAVLFALETGMDTVEVSRLTHRGLAEFRKTHAISPIAQACLDEAPPRHVALQYVFWRESDAGMPLPVFGLEADVFNAFGLIWAEVVQGYNNMVVA
jgi:hypothetical protein